MGYNLAAKATAIGLLALTNGDQAKALRVWKLIEHTHPDDVRAALDVVAGALAHDQNHNP